MTVDYHHISGFQRKSSGDDAVVRAFETSSEIFGYVGVFSEILWRGKSWLEYKPSMAVARTSFP